MNGLELLFFYAETLWKFSFSDNFFSKAKRTLFFFISSVSKSEKLSKATSTLTQISHLLPLIK